MPVVAPSPPGERPRILLVENDPAVRRSLQLLIRAHGYDVRAYRSAVGLAEDPEALRAACLVADLVMPEMDAVELLHSLRAAAWTGPAILVSGFLDERQTARARNNGFEVVLGKPLAESALIRSIAQLIGGSAPAAKVA